MNHHKKFYQLNYFLFTVPPLDVRIFPSQTGAHTADNVYTFHCHSHGSYPPAILSWFDYQGNKIKDSSSEVNQSYIIDYP